MLPAQHLTPMGQVVEVLGVTICTPCERSIDTGGGSASGSAGEAAAVSGLGDRRFEASPTLSTACGQLVDKSRWLERAGACRVVLSIYRSGCAVFASVVV